VQCAQSGFQIFQIVSHSLAALGRDLEDRHARTDRLDIAVGGLPIEFDGCRQIKLGDDCDIGAIEDCGILQRLVLALLLNY
jgi:hypothetical protein